GATGSPQYPTPPWSSRQDRGPYRRAELVSQFTQQVILGLLLGGIYVAVALGFSLVWGILNIVNLAHGALVIVGSYITWDLFTRWHIDPFLSLPIDALVLFVIGYALPRSWLASICATCTP